MNLVRVRRKHRTIRLPNGQLAKVTTEDTGVSIVKTRVRDDGQDALVIPEPIVIRASINREH